MEVDTKEPVLSCTINDLPNEILLIIFRRLNFLELLNISVVCTRWNDVVFHFFSDRIIFRMRTLYIPILSEKRIYRNVKITGRFYQQPQTLHDSRLATLGEHARSLHLELSDARGSILARVLEKFPELRYLRLKIGKYLNDKSPVSFRRMIDGLLPGLEHLTIFCQSAPCTELVAEVAPTLESLDITLMARHRLKLYRCNFASLQSLTLTMDIRSMLYLYNLDRFPANEFITFLAGLTQLRTLRLTIDDSDTFKHIYDFNNIVELSLGGLEPATLTCPLYDISQMTNLKTLSITAHAVLLPFEVQPVPTVTSLKLTKTTEVDIAMLIKIFPNLTVFYMQSSRILSLYEIKWIVSAWSALEELSFGTVQLTEDYGTHILKLNKLRKLVLYGSFVKVVYDPIQRIAQMPSMKKLYLFDSVCIFCFNALNCSWKKGLRCDVYFNGVHVDELSD